MTKKEENAYARKYYKKNAKYREKKIEDRKKRAKENKKAEAEYSREYYWSNANYRNYKRKYAIDYKRSHRRSK